MERLLSKRRMRKLNAWRRQPSTIVNVQKRRRRRKLNAWQRQPKKAAKGDVKWTAEDDASIESMINGGVSFSKIASKLGNGLTQMDIKNRWYRELKKSSGITKPPVKTGPHSSITWTADVDAMIVRMRTDDISFAKIASKLGNCLKKNVIKNR
jgi:hypothetical protein